MYGPNFLMYNTDVVKPAPTSWDITFEPTLNGQPNPYAGKITAYDDPDLHRRRGDVPEDPRPEPGHHRPVRAHAAQLDAAVALLEQQKPLVAKYWSLYTDEIDGFDERVDGGRHGVADQPHVLEDDAPVGAVVPTEGVTGWADTWMMSSHAQHPNCMLKWMKYTLQPEVQAQVAVWYGAAACNARPAR